MKTNRTYTYNHEKLGPLQIEIIAGNQDAISTGIISQEFLIKYEKADIQTFLHALYIEHMSNDNLCDIIGEYLVANDSSSKDQIIGEINSKYSAKYNKNSSQKSTNNLSKGDNIFVAIKSMNIPDSPLFTANVTIRESMGNLMAYVNDNQTREDSRRMGMQTIGFNFLEQYLAENGVAAIGLEAQDLDGNEFNLEDAYRKLGFDKIQGTNKFIKAIEMDENIM